MSEGAGADPHPHVGAYPVRSLPWRKQAILLWGKARRWYLCAIRPGKVRASLARRRGECRHSGACCQLAFVCPLHGPDATGEPGCTIYARRPRNCRVFPLDERDIADRDLVMPDEPCGYHFISEEQARAEAATAGSSVAEALSV